MPISLKTLAFIFFCLGFFTCTWDLLLKVDTHGFTLKIHTLFFLTSFLLLLFQDREKKITHLKALFSLSFTKCILGIYLYFLVQSYWSYYPLKSLLYSSWYLFNFITIFLSAHLMSEYVEKKYIHNLVFLTASFLSVIIIIDHISFQYGFTSGLIGFNQDSILQWGISRPHAFSSEPSYIASFLSISVFFICPEIMKRKSLLSIIFLISMCLAIFCTTSRTGWLCLTLGGVYFVFFYIKSSNQIPWKGLFLSAISIISFIALFYFLMPEKQKKRFNHELLTPVLTWDDGSHNARLRSQLMAWDMAKETYFLGTGLGASYIFRLAKERFKNEKELNEFSKEKIIITEKSDAPEVNRYLRITDEKVRLEKSEKETYTNDRGKEAIMSTWGQILAEGGILVFILYFFSAFFLIEKLLEKKAYLSNCQKLGSLISSLVFFTCVAFFLSNIARGDVWVWFGLWGFNAWNLKETTGRSLHLS